MNWSLEESWRKALELEFDKNYFKKLEVFVEQEYEKKEIYPPKNEIFSAFNNCPLSKLKVVVVGQDPYPGFEQANGLCFSVASGVKHPPSLINIFKELENDLGLQYPKSGDLSRWAKQGVFLLNSTLTVEASKAASHQKQGWETFTDAVIQVINNECENVVFMLWGGFAKKKGKKIDRKKHCILESGHPSPLSANRGYWFGNKHFSKCNKFIKLIAKKEIKWN